MIKAMARGANSMKIAVICWWDSRSGYNLAEALATKYDVTYVNRTDTAWDDYAGAISDADVVLIKGDLHPKRIDGKLHVYHPLDYELPDMSGHELKGGAKLICAPSGGNFRRKIKGYHKAEANRPLSDYIDHCDIIAPMNPDLNYPEINGMYLPMAFNTGITYNAWKERDTMKITAYQSTRDAKGATQYLLPAVKTLRNKGHNIDLVVGRGDGFDPIPYDQFLEHKKGSTVCFGQMSPMGEYGRHGLEAMAYGIPLIISHNEQTIKQAYPVEDFGKPCLKANNLDELKSLLRRILRGALDMKDISRQTYEYVERVHSYKSVVAVFDRIMERIT